MVKAYTFGHSNSFRFPSAVRQINVLFILGSVFRMVRKSEAVVVPGSCFFLHILGFNPPKNPFGSPPITPMCPLHPM